MKPLSATAIVLLLNFAANAQQAPENLTSHIKTRYSINTLITPSRKQVDTTHFEQFNPAQKVTKAAYYQNNNISSVSIIDIDKKGQTLSIGNESSGVLRSKTEYFYNGQGLIIKTISQSYGKLQTGELKVVAIDTVTQTFDKNKNQLTYNSSVMGAHKTFVYDTNNHLIEMDFYPNKTPKAQKEIYIYKGDMLIEKRNIWFDGKLSGRVSNQYDSANHLTEARDSTNGWLSVTKYTYNNKGQRESMVYQKTYNNKTTLTTSNYTYNANGQVQTHTIHSDDSMLAELYPYKYKVAGATQPPFDMKETYEYDKYSNRQKITTELGGQTVGVIDFLMTYY
jgi:hypothetical protein